MTELNSQGAELSHGRVAGSGRWLVCACLVVAGYFAVSNLITWPSRIRYPGELAYIEGVGMTEIAAIANGQKIYARSLPDREYAGNYGPLYYWAGSRLIDGGHPAYFPLRLLSMFATLAAVIGCGILAHRITGEKGAAILAALVALSFHIVSTFGLAARSDAVALALSFWGFLLAHRFMRGRAQLVSVPFFLLSLFWKPQFFAAPLAIIVDHLLAKRYRQALEFIALLACGGLVLLGAVELFLFPGQAPLYHIFWNNVVPLSLPGLRMGLISSLGIWGLPVWAGVQVLRSRRDQPLAAYLILSILICWLGLSKAGADTNYMLEGTLIVSPLFAAWLWSKCRKAGPEILILPALALYLAQLVGLPAPTPADFARDQKIQAYLQSNFRPGTRALGYFAGDLTRAGLDVPYPDLWQAFTRVETGRREAGYLADHIARKEFGVVIASTDLRADPGGSFITLPMRESLFQNYRLACVLDLPGPEMKRPNDHFYAWVPQAPGTAAENEPGIPPRDGCGP